MVSWSEFFCTLFTEIAGSLTEICGRRCREDMWRDLFLLDSVAVELPGIGKLVLRAVESSV